MAQVDEDALAKLVWVVLGIVLLPLALLVGAVLAVLWLRLHWPTWLLLLPVAVAGTWVLVAADPVGDYLGVYETVWSTVEAGRPFVGAGERWPEWIGALAPLSAGIGVTGAAVVVTYLNRR